MKINYISGSSRSGGGRRFQTVDDCLLMMLSFPFDINKNVLSCYHFPHSWRHFIRHIFVAIFLALSQEDDSDWMIPFPIEDTVVNELDNTPLLITATIGNVIQVSELDTLKPDLYLCAEPDSHILKNVTTCGRDVDRKNCDWSDW